MDGRAGAATRDDEPIAVVTTVGDREQAKAIAATLVERRLAACVQIEPIDSVYRWQGRVQHDTEHRLVVKTLRGRWPEVEAAILAAHPYELPAIHAVDFAFVSIAYARWIAESVKPAPSR